MKHSVRVTSVVCVVSLMACGGGDAGQDGTGPDAHSTADVQVEPDVATGADGSPEGGPSDGGASEGGSPDGDIDVPPLSLSFGALPPEITGPARFAGGVSYGGDPAQKIDALLPPKGALTGAVLVVHGGGFRQGDRAGAWTGEGAKEANEAVAAGLAWISVGYRLLNEKGPEPDGVLKPLSDVRRALQFVRYHAASFDVDPVHIGMRGNSAGAGTSLWIAFSPDMADPSSPDPIARVSTRVSAAAVRRAQSTYDLMRWAPDVFTTYGVTTDDLLFGTAALREDAARFYGLPLTAAATAESMRKALGTPEMTAYRAKVDMLGHYSADDPPVHVVNEGDAAPPTDPKKFDALHHPLHAAALRDRAAAVSASIQVGAPALGIKTTVKQLDFLLEHLR